MKWGWLISRDSRQFRKKVNHTNLSNARLDTDTPSRIGGAAAFKKSEQIFSAKIRDGDALFLVLVKFSGFEEE